MLSDITNRWRPQEVGVLVQVLRLRCVGMCVLPSPTGSSQPLLAKEWWKLARGPCRSLWWRVMCQGGFCDLQGSFIISLNLNRLLCTTEGFGPCTCLRNVCKMLIWWWLMAWPCWPGYPHYWLWCFQSIFLEHFPLFLLFVAGFEALGMAEIPQLWIFLPHVR